jgi:transcriptional/translational regulatory protein YebC/TACO1
MLPFRFKKVGQIEFSGIDEKKRNEFTDAAVGGGADDIFDNENGNMTLVCAPDQLAALKTSMKNAGFEADSSEIVFVPNAKVEISEEEYEQVYQFIQDLEKIEDVEDIVHDAA